MVPTLPNPSLDQSLVPNPVGPDDRSPLPAWPQQSVGRYPVEKFSNWGGVNAKQGVVNVDGNDQILESPTPQIDLT